MGLTLIQRSEGPPPVKPRIALVLAGGAITGGAFYDPPTSQFPSAYFGTYLFSDFCSGWIRRLNVTTRAAALSYRASF